MSGTPGLNLEVLQEFGISRLGVVARACEADTGRSVLVYPGTDAVVSPDPFSPGTVLDARRDARRLAALLADAARILAERHAQGEVDGQLRTGRFLLLPGPSGEEVICVAHSAAEG